ncbi:Asp-tRNA(Asn)/Glu-tRNA(Gln) amidotransferase subunit GatA [Aerococcus suis]|uniref:Glutamyl-tRNA(Gln) amidotransferase subunit A n=1 Tax=Aerococcus suis TaxID=371602 RepID=A0A1W1Z9S0_9LACT|nr:Asp-tRNA(Asn)/Glu-tRNA(Gln) amidotransferase subunit GatA [Aerococcus suis]MDD7758555.1 Asp-tRNA(Asn)/Glu-tRNA(Gln) amidotransferase subunit GatA [Aerococcus suis]MDY4646582.1 Asp-tRNA(Asn)/Glu-tRNA(Gln) amidotransferase subunit GatA [Aerococcus suis]SMC44708.1 aspartyl/glutamyl-tRNA(Asn/Gln) amidotransferase subunit A [Aerococcus suis]
MTTDMMTIRELNRQLVAGETTSVELVQAALDRINATDETIHAFITLSETALEEAKASDEKGYSTDRPLQGIPLGIKDNILTDGIRTTAASRMLEDFVPFFDATIIEKLKAAGAIIIGKTNMDEFAMGASSETSYFGPTKNPWNTDYVPGGSSGGSAATVSAGQVLGALGSDTGGSIRQPASFTGIVGMKPTYGRVSRWGVIAFASSLDQVGPMTHNVEDNALMLETIAGHDDKDSTSAELDVPAFAANLDKGVKGMKIAVPEEYFGAGVDEETQATVKAAIKQLEDLGATVDTVHLPHMKYGVPVYYIIASAEASSNLQRYDGIRYGYRAEDAESLEDLYIKSRSEGFGMEVKRRLMTGTFSIASENIDDYFMQAGRVRSLIKEDFKKLFNDYDLVVGPVAPSPAYKFGENADDPVAAYQADLLTVPVNLAGLPGLSLPVGFSEAGLPIGLQIIGNYFDEERIYQAAYALEQVNDASQQRPE